MGPQFWQTVCQVLFAFGVLLTAFAGYGAFHFGQKVDELSQKKSAQAGILTPTSVFENGLPAPGFPKVTIGDSESGFVWVGKKDIAMFEFFNSNSLSVKLVDRQISVSLDLRNGAGDLVAQLRGNEWKVNPANTWDRNYTRDSLEVISPDGKVVLQLRLVHEGVRIQCKMFGPNGECFGIWSGLGPDGHIGGFMSLAKNERGHSEIPDIAPKFKYPSELHFGELKLIKK